MPQFQKDRHFDYVKAVDGCRQILWGFFKKLVIADNCASVVNTYWDSFANLNGITLFALGVLFAFQIYCDFSGYSDIAIGCAKLFGINLMRNFNYPYFSKSIPEFWRRWHISLTTWFRDYIYFPLGGSRCSKWKTIRNVFIVWSISGLWHGANWTFICWGLFHAVLLTCYNLLGINTKKPDTIDCKEKVLPGFMDIIKMIPTFFLVVIGWIIFRAENMSQAFAYLSRMFSHLLDSPTIKYGRVFLLYSVIVLIIEWLQRDKEHVLQFPTSGIFKYRCVRWFFYFALVLLILGFSGASQSFIYFQF